MESQDEIKYIKRILDGETNLFAYFINSYSNSIYSLIVRIIPSKEDAEELVQDTFLKAFRKLDTFRGDCSFSTWLFRIGYNTAVSATRKRKTIFPVVDESQLEQVVDEDVDTIFDNENDEDLLQRLEVAIEKLNTEDKALITLFYFENKPVAEVSEVLQLTTENVKVKLHRIRKKLYVLINMKTK